MSPEEQGGFLAERFQDKARDAAHAFTDLMEITDPEAGAAVMRHKEAFIAGIEAGIAGALVAFKDLGFFDEQGIERLQNELGGDRP